MVLHIILLAIGAIWIFQVIRLDHGIPEVDPKADNAPPFDPNGPVWKRLDESGRAGIWRMIKVDRFTGAYS